MANIGLMPLLMDNAHSAAMIRHAMDDICAAVHHLNPRQMPILAMDQPLFAIAKELQWAFPQTYGEHKFVIMLGGLHTEMAAIKVLGDLMDGSGWTHILTTADVATSGVAHSFIKGSHLTRTRHAHQVTAAALCIPQRQAYSSYLESCEENCDSFDDWSEQMERQQPQYAYWVLVLKLQLLVLQLVHSIRSADFRKYIESLTMLMPCFSHWITSTTPAGCLYTSVIYLCWRQHILLFSHSSCLVHSRCRRLTANSRPLLWTRHMNSAMLWSKVREVQLD